MKLSILLTFTILSSFPSLISFDLPQCDKIEAVIETKIPTKGGSDGEIQVKAKGGVGKLRYFFFNSKGYPLNSNKEEINQIKNLKEGDYKCSISDEEGCIKLLVIELK